MEATPKAAYIAGVEDVRAAYADMTAETEDPMSIEDRLNTENKFGDRRRQQQQEEEKEEFMTDQNIQLKEYAMAHTQKLFNAQVDALASFSPPNVDGGGGGGADDQSDVPAASMNLGGGGGGGGGDSSSDDDDDDNDDDDDEAERAFVAGLDSGLHYRIVDSIGRHSKDYTAAHLNAHLTKTLWKDLCSPTGNAAGLTILSEDFNVDLPPGLNPEFEEYQSQVEGRCLVHSLANASHSDGAFTLDAAQATPHAQTKGMLGGNDSWFNDDVLMEVLESSDQRAGCVVLKNNRMYTERSAPEVKAGRLVTTVPKAGRGDRSSLVLTQSGPPDFARLIDTAAIIFKDGHFTAIINLHECYYRRYPVRLATRAGLVLLDADDNSMSQATSRVCGQMVEAAIEIEQEAWRRKDDAKPIFRDPKTPGDPHRKQLLFDEMKYEKLATKLTRRFYWSLLSSEEHSLDGWAADEFDAERRTLTHAANIQCLLRFGKGDAYNKLLHQARHCDCPPSGLGPDQHGIKWRKGVEGVNVDSCIVTGSKASKIWISVSDGVNTVMRLLILPPRHLLFFPGSFFHAGADFAADNAVIHFYMGGNDMMMALQEYGTALFDTTHYDTDTADEDGFRSSPSSSTPSAAKLKTGPSSQTTLSQSLPDHVNRAKELQRAAADVAADLKGEKRPAPEVSPARKKARDSAAANQNKQADGMQLRAYKQQGPIEHGTIVNLPVPEQDRPRLVGTTISLVVLDVSENKKYFRVGNTNGFLKQMYGRDALTTTQNMSPKQLGIPDVIQLYRAGQLEQRNLRDLIAAESPTGAQGAGRCYCQKGQCNTKACTCFRMGVPCRSSCHTGMCACLNDGSLDYACKPAKAPAAKRQRK
jgi:hypothetical protein